MADRNQIQEGHSVLRLPPKRNLDRVRIPEHREPRRAAGDDERFVTDWWEPEPSKIVK